jgi:hypothetical protein
MTEAEWLACDDPVAPMLNFLRGKASDRKLRLFAVACCQRVRTSLPDERCGKTIDTAERFADGLATADELRRAAAEADSVRQDATGTWI